MNYMIAQLLNLINYSILTQEKGLDQRIDEAFQPVSDIFSERIFSCWRLSFCNLSPSW